MSRLNEDTSRASVLYSARLVIRAHDRGIRCHLECPGAGCKLHAWARQELAQPPHTVDRPQPAAGTARRTA